MSTSSRTLVCHQPSHLPASTWVERWLETAIRFSESSVAVAPMPTRKKRALDWACGSGRHSIAAAVTGYDVIGVDTSIEAAQALRLTLPHLAQQLSFQSVDLEASRNGGGVCGLEQFYVDQRTQGGFDLIIVTNYLFRPRLALLAGLLRRGGTIIYETFAAGNQDFGKPSRADFLLAPNELLDFAQSAGLSVVAFEQGLVDGPALKQRLVACVTTGNPKSRALAEVARYNIDFRG